MPEVAVVLGDLVLEDEVVAKRVPDELGDRAVILMGVGSRGAEDQVGLEARFFSLSNSLLDRRELRGEESVAEPLDDDPRARRAVEKEGRGPARLAGPLGVALKTTQSTSAFRFGEQPQDRAAAADLDVVGVRAEAQQAQRRPPGSQARGVASARAGRGARGRPAGRVVPPGASRRRPRAPCGRRRGRRGRPRPCDRCPRRCARS